MEQIKERKSPAPAKNTGPDKIIHTSHNNKAGTQSNKKSSFKSKKEQCLMTPTPESIPKQMDLRSKSLQIVHLNPFGGSDHASGTKKELSGEAREAQEVIMRYLTPQEFEFLMVQSCKYLFRIFSPNVINRYVVSVCPWSKEDGPPTFHSEYGRGNRDGDHGCSKYSVLVDPLGHAMGLDDFALVFAFLVLSSIPLDSQLDELGFPLPCPEAWDGGKDHKLVAQNDQVIQWSYSPQEIELVMQHGIFPWEEGESKFPKKIFPKSLADWFDESSFLSDLLWDPIDNPTRDLVRFRITKRGGLAEIQMPLDVFGPLKVSNGTESFAQN